ncbi:hypothetical protein BXZ70DRAFT_899301 [Cristinia sonorae]|uniref:Polysaccharide lyase 14 domain-containing protein n=1 Tax=Cristinia sonorae TaxID=1940300 RepID=A0A8K0UHL9_9AGAR|nr:hypothetical protein BXZ70DRAFT_899301 [Cristinia sonorae]
MNALFPVPASLVLSGFTTSPAAASTLPLLALVPLTDPTLGVHKVTSHTTHHVVAPPPPVHSDPQHDPIEAWEAVFPQGSINPGNKDAPRGGFGFYLRGPKDFAQELRSASEVLLSYAVMFQDGWMWKKGGKLPGIYGGVGDSAYGCTGGRQTDRCKCFNLRLMWREHGAGELYAYVPQNPTNTEQMTSIPPRSVQNPDYGFSVGMGAWYFAPGKWTVVAERIKMNAVGKSDGEAAICSISRNDALHAFSSGEIEVFIDGRSVVRVRGLILRDETAEDSHVQGLHFQTFFGGHSVEWASPQTQRAYFAHLSGAILRSSTSERTREEL